MAADAESERLAVKAAWCAEPTLSRGYGEQERQQRDRAKQARLVAERARRQLARRGGASPSPAAAAVGRGVGDPAEQAPGMLFKADLGKRLYAAAQRDQARRREIRERADRLERLAREVTGRDLREGYEQLAEQARRQAEGG
jgi:hypothetical protein